VTIRFIPTLLERISGTARRLYLLSLPHPRL
jgi:hypothetical protein